MSERSQDSAFGPGAPSIVRLAGLPAQAVEPLSSPLCFAQAAALEQSEAALADLRRQWVDALHAAVSGAPPAHRNLLLAVKRDTFNGRPLKRFRERADWPAVRAAAPALADSLSAAEDQRDTLAAELAAAFEAERGREWRHLLGLLDDEAFKRGLTLSSPELVQNLDRLRQGGQLSPRRLHRAEQSLLRYASRTSLKLSPFSTLTRVGLALSTPARNGASLALLTGAERQHQKRRYGWLNLAHLYCLLRRHRPFRSRLRVYLNDTIEELEPGRFRLIRPYDWDYRPDVGEIHYFYEAVVKVGLEGPMIEELLAHPERRTPLQDLQQALAAKTGLAAEEISSGLDKLLRAGFLLFELPWASTDAEPERCLGRMLAAAPDGDPLSLGLAALLEELERLVATEPTSASLPALQARMAQVVGEAFDLLRAQLGLPDLRIEIDQKFHEDIFLTSDRPESEYGEIVRIPLDSAQRALRSIQPMMMFSDLNYTRYEYLLSLRELGRRQWPGKARVPVVDLMNQSQALWKEHVRISTAQINDVLTDLWNPYDLDAIREVREVRKEVRAGLMASLAAEEGDFVYDLGAAERAVENIPAHLRPTFGPCLFMQPAAKDQDLWVLNHLLDGNGRFSTRYTKVMPEEMCGRFTRHFEQRSIYGLDGEEAEVVDIFCSRADQLNIHALQTPRVLELPGESLQLPPERTLRVSNLMVDLESPMPRLFDRQGKRILPVFLGATSLFPMPTLVKFLAHFSLPEFRLVYPQRPAEKSGSLSYLGRIRIGNLVLHRRLWVSSPARDFGDLGQLSDLELYRKVNRWRLENDLPQQVFLSEKLVTRFKLWQLHKPQFIDFSSPSFLPILRTCCEAGGDRLEIREMLPSPEAFPPGSDGRQWAIEIQLEARAFKESAARREAPGELAEARRPAAGRTRDAPAR